MGKENDEKPQPTPKPEPVHEPEKPRVQIPQEPRPELVNIQTEGTEAPPEKKEK